MLFDNLLMDKSCFFILENAKIMAELFFLGREKVTQYTPSSRAYTPMVVRSVASHRRQATLVVADKVSTCVSRYEKLQKKTRLPYQNCNKVYFFLAITKKGSVPSTYYVTPTHRNKNNV